MKAEDAIKLRQEILTIDSWSDGKLTASPNAGKIKNNYELTGKNSSDKTKAICEKMFIDENISSFALPKVIHSSMFSKTSKGMGYGLHFDSGYMGVNRCDLSFTLFLSEPSEYTGGELSLEMPPEKRDIKLNAGEIVIYPTKYFHEVKTVKKGERVVCVGWIQSKVSSHEERSYLYNLKVTANHLIKTHGPSKATNNLFLIYYELLKKFAN